MLTAEEAQLLKRKAEEKEATAAAKAVKKQKISKSQPASVSLGLASENSGFGPVVARAGVTVEAITRSSGVKAVAQSIGTAQGGLPVENSAQNSTTRQWGFVNTFITDMHM